MLELRLGGKKAFIVDDFDQISFGLEEGDGLGWLLLLNFSLPLGDAFHGGALVGGTADGKDVSTLILRLSIHTQVLITTGIMDL